MCTSLDTTRRPRRRKPFAHQLCVLTAWALLLNGCASPLPPEPRDAPGETATPPVGNATPPENPEKRACLPPPELTEQIETIQNAPFQEPKYPRSRLWIEGELGKKQLLKRLNKEIPWVLAKEKDRPVGAPGRATYEIKRGAFSLRGRADHIELKVPIKADISVCKPIGSMCLGYGQCQPKFEAKFKLFTTPSGFEFKAPSGGIRATKECVIGVNVTPQLEQEALKEVKKVEAEIRARWPKIKPYAARAWRQLQEPLKIAEGHCLQVTPLEVLLTPPRLTEIQQETGAKRVIAAGVGIGAHISASESCEPQKRVPLAAAPSVRESVHPKSTLWLPQLVTHKQLEKAIESRLEKESLKQPQLKIRLLEMKATPRGIALRLEAAGESCGEFWAVGRLRANHSSGAISLKLRAAEGTPDLSQALKLRLKEFSEHVIIESQYPDFSAAKSYLKRIRRELPKEFELEIGNLLLGPPRLRVTSEGISSHRPFSSKLKLKLK